VHTGAIEPASERPMHQQHVLLSAAAGTLSMREVFAMSDDQAFEALREVGSGRGGRVSGLRGRRGALVPAEPPPVALPGLWTHLLGHLRDHLRPPQAAVAGLPRGHRDLHLRGQGLVGAATEPGSGRPVQNRLRIDAQAASKPHGSTRRDTASGRGADRRGLCRRRGTPREPG
jgi:hypothetical protein